MKSKEIAWGWNVFLLLLCVHHPRHNLWVYRSDDYIYCERDQRSCTLGKLVKTQADIIGQQIPNNSIQKKPQHLAIQTIRQTLRR